MGGYLNGVGGGSAASLDRSTQENSIAQANNIFSRGLNIADTNTPGAQSAVSSGLSGLDAARNRWQSIMNGSPTAVATAVAPTLNTVNQQADAQRRQQASQGTSRQGGVNPGDQQAEQQRMSTVANTTGQLAAEAPGQLAQTSSAEAAAGDAQLNEALKALGLNSETAQGLINSSITSRQNDVANNPLNSILSKSLGSLAGTGLGAINGALNSALDGLGF